MHHPSFSLKWVVSETLFGFKAILKIDASCGLVLEFTLKSVVYELIVIFYLSTFPRSSLSDKSDITEKTVDVSTKRDKPVVRPEEIPPVPENRFLLRRDVPIVSVEPEP